MTDSSSFSSLLELVESHLSKKNIPQNQSKDVTSNSEHSIQIPSYNSTHKSTASETLISRSPGQRLPIPTFSEGQSPIQSVLAEQISNMLKAKELKKEQEEKQKLEAEMKKLKIQEEDDFVIDLMQAIQKPYQPEPSILTCSENGLSNSSSFESLFNPKFIDCDEKKQKPEDLEPLLPCKTDMSYILNIKIRKAKCSAFGKVLTSRLAVVAAPYLKVKIDSPIKRFDFNTKSPCDLIKEQLRKPTSYNTYNFDIFSMI